MDNLCPHRDYPMSTHASRYTYVSALTELLPGDVIATGTPDGVGLARTPPRWLADGDVLEVDITCVGLLRNNVVIEPEPGRQPRWRSIS